MKNQLGKQYLVKTGNIIIENGKRYSQEEFNEQMHFCCIVLVVECMRDDILEQV